MGNNKTREEIDKEANEKFSKLTESEIIERAKNYKKRDVLEMSITAAVALIAFVIIFCYIPTLTKGESLGAEIICFAVLMALFCVGTPIFMLINTLRKTNEQLAFLSIKKEIKQNANVANNTNIDFCPSKTISISTEGFSSGKILIDEKNKKFLYQHGKNSSKVYNFSDIINYEVYENGSSKVKGTAGKALIGGAFFSIGGMIIGSSMGKKIKEKCNSLKLIIRINDISCPQITITYVEHADWDMSGTIYKQIKDNLHETCSILEYMINTKTLEENSSKDNQIGSVKQMSSKEQLQELKELFDEDLITQEEYEKKKKQILGL